MSRQSPPLDIQIVDLMWIDPAARGLAAGAEANVQNLLADAALNFVLVKAESNFVKILAGQDPSRVRVIPIGGPAPLVKRELWIVRLFAGALLADREIVYTSWLPRLCLSVLLLPMRCRVFVHDLNIFRAGIYYAAFRQPSFLSRLHQYLSIKRASVVECFARSVARQLRRLRRDAIAVVAQTVTVIAPERGGKRADRAVIFLDARNYKGTWALERFYSSKPGFTLTVIGKIDPAGRELLQSRGIAVHETRPSDREKFDLLAEAAFVIFASKYEGFGLPPREAAAVGTPSLIARRAALLDVPARLSLSIEKLGPHIDLAEVAERAARFDPDALRRWGGGFLGPVNTFWRRAPAGRAAPQAPSRDSRLSERSA